MIIKRVTTPIGRSRYIAITIGTGVIALVTAVYLIGAPPVAAVLGVGGAVGWLVWRAPAA